jgi:hypothetical protein
LTRIVGDVERNTGPEDMAITLADGSVIGVIIKFIAWSTQNHIEFSMNGKEALLSMGRVPHVV